MFIAVTRLKEKADRDAGLCIAYGHKCYTVSPLAAKLYQDRVEEFARRANDGEFDCIFFTSALPAKVMAPLLISPPRVIAIGPQTARTLAEEGIASETLPSFYSRDFAPYLGGWLRGRHVGIPRADVPNPALIEGIESYGGKAHESRIYGLEPTGEILSVENADAILFTSANSFRYARWERRSNLLLMAIGEITAAAMREGGAPPAVVGDGSLEGTLKALNHYLGSKGGE
jgi:uroporphyrinogen-III synthase